MLHQMTKFAYTYICGASWVQALPGTEPNVCISYNPPYSTHCVRANKKCGLYEIHNIPLFALNFSIFQRQNTFFSKKSDQQWHWLAHLCCLSCRFLCSLGTEKSPGKYVWKWRCWENCIIRKASNKKLRVNNALGLTLYIYASWD